MPYLLRRRWLRAGAAARADRATLAPARGAAAAQHDLGNAKVGIHGQILVGAPGAVRRAGAGGGGGSAAARDGGKTDLGAGVFVPILT